MPLIAAEMGRWFTLRQRAAWRQTSRPGRKHQASMVANHRDRRYRHWVRSGFGGPGGFAWSSARARPKWVTARSDVFSDRHAGNARCAS